jgi:tetratricopeptide (TPR) repeat protein
MKACFRFAGIGVLAAAVVLAQPNPGTGFRVRGEVSPLPPGAGILTVELSGSGTGPAVTAVVASDGSFEFHAPLSGAYELRLMSGGTVVHQETVFVNSSSQPISIRLSAPPSTGTRPSQNTVSLKQLSHKIPPQARKAFDKGEQAEGKGRYQEAADFFREAVSIDPEYTDAFNELGAMQARQGDLPHAAESFRKAVDVAPEDAMGLSNLSIVLAKMRKFDEAAEVARRAVRVMPGSGTVRFVLATSLLLGSGDSPEVLDNLERSAPEIPRAHLVAAQLLARRGRREDAIRHVEDYLRAVPDSDQDRERARALLEELRR